MPEKKPSWQHGDAKELLREHLVVGKLPIDMPPNQVWQRFKDRPQFADFCSDEDKKKFSPRLNDLKMQLKIKEHRAFCDLLALEHDLLIHPESARNHRGEPRWEGSEAQRLLKLDVAAGRDKNKTPRDFRTERIEYLQYPLDVFRRHIYQERSCIKQHNCFQRKEIEKYCRRQP
jgi:hypothetical protein